MSTATKEITTADRLRRIAESSRLVVDKARAILDDLFELKEQAEALRDANVMDAVSTILDALDDMVPFAPADTIQAARDALEDLQNLDCLSELDAFIDAWDEADQYTLTVEAYRDDPASGDAEEKADARDECRETLIALADALDVVEP